MDSDTEDEEEIPVMIVTCHDVMSHDSNTLDQYNHDTASVVLLTLEDNFCDLKSF